MTDTENKIHLEIESVNKQTEDLTNNLEEQLGNIENVMDKKINSDIMPRIGHIDTIVDDIEKDIRPSVASNTKAISDLRNQITESISDKLRPTEDKINNLDATIQDVNKTLAIYDGRHVETVEKMKEVTVLTNNIQLQIKAQEQKMIEQSANDLNQIRDQLRDIENQAGLSDQKIQELDAGSQTLQEKVLGMENQVADRLEDLAKSDASLLAKINGLDTGNQQLLEKLLEVEKEVEGKLSDNASSLQTRMDTLDGDNKANTLQIVNIQESINIQAEHVKKVDAERQLNAAKAKEDLEAAVADNERAISELRNELDNSIVEKFKPTEDKLNGIDGQVQILNKSVTFFESHHAETVEKFKEVNVITNTIQTQMKEQEQKMVEQSANDLIKIREQLVNLENITTVSNQEIDAVKKQTDNLAGHVENQLANMEDAMDKKINTDIMPRIGHLDSGNQNLVEKLLGFQTDFDGKLKKQEQMDDSLLNKINELQLNNNDNVSSLQNQLADLDSDNKNNIQQIFTLQESINIQSEQVKKVDAERQKEANKTKEDIESTIASNAKAISDLRNELANSIADKFKPTEDKINNIDNSLQDVNKTLAIFDGRHVETVEKMKEMTVITNNIQVQIK